MSFELAWPLVLALLPLPLVVARFVPRAPDREEAALKVPFFAALEQAVGQRRGRPSRARLGLGGMAWLLLVLAASRPQLVGAPQVLPVTGRDLMLAVDISGSMATDDMFLDSHQVTRLTAVKQLAGDFIERRQGDRLGLILFGRQAYLQTPLTLDRETVHTLLDEAVVGLAGKETAIGDAIGLGVKRLREQPEQNRVMVLLTDGANTAGAVDPLRAAALAAEEGIRIYTIGVGAEAMVIRTPFGLQRVNPSRDLDEGTLATIADKTGGEYFRARDTERLGEIYRLLDQIEPVSVDEETYRPIEELYAWPLALALGISVVMAWTALGLSGHVRRAKESYAR
jgi:Ca-activated chloride channel family protein